MWCWQILATMQSDLAVRMGGVQLRNDTIPKLTQ